jgi:hypothetical protein
MRVKRLVVMSMSEALLSDPILASFRAALDELYGDSLERAVLFGSPHAEMRTKIPTTTWLSFYEILPIAGARLTAWRP